ncbi:hypothetical protein TIFTF001_046350 [Ficus carica]|uniref:C-JID domain-containing protein n=1 Tax=Ficus carica TaxID=3494 RepID=A0AA87Z3Y0_FICCA|nr:hypothetical protein TIFTF001_046350 [Ficus carica]
MHGLRLLKVNGGKLCLPQNHPLAFPCKLKYINWYACPFKSLSTNFVAEMLVELDMRGSRLEKLWKGAPKLDKLKRINLSGSKHLTQVPDLSQAPNIEIMHFDFCGHLTKVPSYVRYLTKLQGLSLKGCTSLCELSKLPKNLRALNVLTGPAEHNTNYCILSEKWDEWVPPLNFSSKFPIISEPLELITILILEFVAIEEIGFCRKLESLPVLPFSLAYLDATCCTSLKTMSSSIPSVNQNWNHLHNRGYFWENFVFLGCEMLDENARKILMEDALFRILRFATFISTFGACGLISEMNRSYWPGSEILSWFSHKSEGSSISINLPDPDHQLNNNRHLGLAFCLIIEFKDLMLARICSMLHVESTYMFPNGYSQRQSRNLEFPFLSGDGKCFRDGLYQFPYKETSEKNINGSLNSEYVFVFIDSSSGVCIKTEEGRFNIELAACTTSTATFSFSFSLDDQKLAKINKCGVHLLYSKQAERLFGYVSKSSGDEEEKEDDDDYNGGGESDSSGREAIHSESDDQEEGQ